MSKELVRVCTYDYRQFQQTTQCLQARKWRTKLTTWFFVAGSNSVEFASLNLRMLLANSITATCIPRQTPANNNTAETGRHLELPNTLLATHNQQWPGMLRLKKLVFKSTQTSFRWRNSNIIASPCLYWEQMWFQRPAKAGKGRCLPCQAGRVKMWNT